MRSPTTTTAVTARDARAAVVYIVAVLVLVLAGIEDAPLLGSLISDGPLWPGPVSLALMLLCAALTAFRTARPLVLLAVIVPVALAEIFLGTQTSAYLLIVEALWAPVARGSRKLARATTIVGVVVAVTLGGVFLMAGVVELPWTTAAVFAGLIIVVVVFTPLAWAWEVRHHRMAQEAAESLAAAEHALAGERATREVEADRLRIAHDLHDVVAGHLSAVTLHTSLAEDLEDRTARERSLETARGSAEAALRDLRSVIDVLSRSGSGDGGGNARTTLSWDILRRRLGEDATVEIADEVDEVPVGVRTTMLHIAAEAVTNANRHGEAPRSLKVAVEDGSMTLHCVNAVTVDPSESSPAPPSEPALGLRTMANRAATVGGTVRAGPSGETGERLWTVAARLPLDPDNPEDGA